MNQFDFADRAHKDEVFRRPESFFSFGIQLPDGLAYTIDYTVGDKTLKIFRAQDSHAHKIKNPYDSEEHLPFLLTTDVLPTGPDQWPVRHFGYKVDAPVYGLIEHEGKGSSSLIIKDETVGYIRQGILNRGSKGAIDLGDYPSIPQPRAFQDKLWNVHPTLREKIYNAIILTAMAADKSQEVSSG